MTTKVMDKPSLADLLARQAELQAQIDAAAVETPEEFIAAVEISEKASASPEVLARLQKLTNPLKQAAQEAKEEKAWSSLTEAMREKIVKAFPKDGKVLETGDQNIDTQARTYISGMVYEKLPYLVRELPEGLSLEIRVVQKGTKSWPITIETPQEPVRNKIIRETAISVASKTGFDFSKYHINTHVDKDAETKEVKVTFSKLAIGHSTKRVIKVGTPRPNNGTRAESQNRHRVYNSVDYPNAKALRDTFSQFAASKSSAVADLATIGIKYYELPVW